MLQTVEAEIEVNGVVRLLEPLRITKKTRAIVTILDESSYQNESKSNSQQILELLKSPEFANRKSYEAKEIEMQINEARDSWE